MRVLVTGISGLQRERAWSSLSLSENVIDIGKEMLKISKERNMALTEDNILHAGRDTLSALRAAAIARNINKLPQKDEDRSKMSIVSAHSIFARVDGLEPGLQTNDLKELRPEVWITLIDGPQSIQVRLKQHKAEYFHMSVWDIVKWQEIEVFFSNHLANDLNIRHYVVPVTQHEAFQAIVKGEPKPTVYSSYPMSHASPEVKEKIERFVEKLKKYYVVFDPSSIESSHGLKQHHTQRDLQAISSHTIVRDLDWFIRINADAVVAYWPDVIFSSGMSDELRYAFETGKQTILVTERKQQGNLPLLSPFMTYKAKVFWSSKEFFNFLDLSDFEQRIFSICQEVMFESFRLHDTGITTLTSKDFLSECKRVIEYRLTTQDAKKAGTDVTKISDLIFQSWKPMLDKASRKGLPRQNGSSDDKPA